MLNQTLTSENVASFTIKISITVIDSITTFSLVQYFFL